MQYYSTKAHTQARSQTVNTVTALASIVGAYTYTSLYRVSQEERT